MNDENLAAAQAWLAERYPSRWRRSGRVCRWLARRKETWAVLASVPCGFGLANLGIDGHLAIRAMTLAGPVMAVGLLVFLRRAWGQNFTAPPLTADLATTEPADQGDLASDRADDLAKAPGRPVTVTAGQPTVMVTVLPPVSTQPTIPLSGIAVAKAGEPVYVPWKDPDGDD